jgi:adenosylcobinamide kinase/adenosylcobinamide-phosphate guanylyltransferase
MSQDSLRLGLILGGARSGKSRHAEAIVTALPSPWVYLATGRAWDEEMRERIALHRQRREAGWRTVEVPVALADALDREAAHPVLVDCLTLWLTNLLLEEHDVAQATDALLAALERRRAPTVLVGSEVGLGIVPDTALGRRFRDEAGLLHQKIAAVADRVVLVVAGLALTMKDAPVDRTR